MAGLKTYVLKDLQQAIKLCKNDFEFSEHTLKSSCAMRFVCLQNIHAGAFFCNKLEKLTVHISALASILKWFKTINF